MTEIKDIHESELFGIVVETGCGAAITNRLTALPGASSTLYFAKIPYSKQYEELQYGEFRRSVSKEFVKQATIVESDKLSLKELARVNFIVVSSWQMATEQGQLTHGWYALSTSDLDFFHLIHFSFPKKYPAGVGLTSREKLIDRIGQIGTQLIHCMIGGSEGFEDRLAQVDTDAFIDEHYDVHGEMTSAPIKMLENKGDDYMLVYGPDGMVRFEELMRKGDKFVVNKGSFNPLHHAHVQITDHGAKAIPGAVPVFMISTYRYDKPHIPWEELKPRIEAITRLGYHVIICKEAFFYNTFELLTRHTYPNKTFYFAIGTDTLNRICQTDKLQGTVQTMAKRYADKFKFLVFERQGVTLEPETAWYEPFVIKMDDYKDDGVSSTKIRNGEIQNKI